MDKLKALIKANAEAVQELSDAMWTAGKERDSETLKSFSLYLDALVEHVENTL